MEQAVKQRLIGALVLALLAFIFLPMLVKGPDRASSDAAQVPIDMPKPDQGAFETRDLPLNVPNAPAGSEGVLGLKPADRKPADLPAPTAEIAAPVTETPNASEAVPIQDSAPVQAPVQTPTAPVENKPAAVEVPDTKPVPLPAVAAGDYVVKVGTFSNKQSADDLIKRLKADGLPASTDRVTVNGASAIRVKVGPYADRTRAEAARLRANSVSGGSAQIVTADAIASTVSNSSKPAAENKSEAKPAAASSATGWAVQLAALASESDANALRDKARRAGFAAFVQKVQSDSGTRYRVRVGPEADKIAADRLRVAIAEKLGIADAVVRPHP